MKKSLAMLMMIVLLAVLAAGAQAASAASGTNPGAKKTQGPEKATERAAERATEAAEEALEEVADPDDNGKPDNDARKATQQAERTTRQTEKASQRDTEHGNGMGGKKEHLKGTIEAVSSGSLQVSLKDGSSASVMMDDSTRIMIPGIKDAGHGDLSAGMSVGIQAKLDETDGKIALKVQVIPGKPQSAHHVGKVTSYTRGESIIIAGPDGSTSAYALSDDVKILPAERSEALGAGSSVTIIAPRDPGSQEPAASGIDVHPDKAAQ